MSYPVIFKRYLNAKIVNLEYFNNFFFFFFFFKNKVTRKIIQIVVEHELLFIENNFKHNPEKKKQNKKKQTNKNKQQIYPNLFRPNESKQRFYLLTCQEESQIVNRATKNLFLLRLLITQSDACIKTMFVCCFHIDFIPNPPKTV